LVVACLFLTARIANAEDATISVGGTSIALPAPEGFFRYDGKSAKIDALEQRLLAASNRLLAAFGSEETLADVLLDHLPKIERQFRAQSERSLESVTVTPVSFNKMKPEIRNTVSSQAAKYHSLAKDIEASASIAIGSTLTIGEAIPLGVFDETTDSLCFSMLMKVKIAAISDSEVSIVTCCVIRVSNRVLYLTANSPYRDRSDIEWARRSVQRWRDAVIQANAKS
jgi:hypothetical protein